MISQLTEEITNTVFKYIFEHITPPLCENLATLDSTLDSTPFMHPNLNPKKCIFMHDEKTHLHHTTDQNIKNGPTIANDLQDQASNT